MRNRRTPALRIATVVIQAALSVAMPAVGAENNPAPTGLPGVEGTYRIVQPAPPEPEPNEAATATGGQYGRWDVTISGKFTVDTGAGNLLPPRR